MAQNPIVTITMENGDVIKAELYPESAPITVNNFISLINRHFYDGLIFHRVISGFMIQGGDPEGAPEGLPGSGCGYHCGGRHLYRIFYRGDAAGDGGIPDSGHGFPGFRPGGIQKRSGPLDPPDGRGAGGTAVGGGSGGMYGGIVGICGGKRLGYMEKLLASVENGWYPEGGSAAYIK